MTVPVSEEKKKRIEAETRAWEDWADRVARDHPDWGWYLDPAERPKLPWWKHLLAIPPSEKELARAREAARKAREASGGN